jgi:hypothetical protein
MSEYSKLKARFESLQIFLHGYSRVAPNEINRNMRPCESSDISSRRQPQWQHQRSGPLNGKYLKDTHTS